MVVIGVKVAKLIEDIKAFSQNMMHESMEITDRLYGRLANDDVRQTIKRLGIFENVSAAKVDKQELLKLF